MEQKRDYGFDALANGLLSRITEFPVRSARQPQFTPEVFSSFHLDSTHLVGPITVSLADGTGRERGRSFPGGKRGLVDGDYDQAARLAEALQSLPTYVDALSRRFVLDTLFDWLQLRDAHGAVAEFSAFLQEKASEAVKPVEIWIPLCRVHIESEFAVGEVTLRTISADMITRWEGHIDRFLKTSEEKRAVQTAFIRNRKEMQGTAAAVVAVSAERHRAAELARERTSDALSTLRFFSIANYSPFFRSYCAPSDTRT